MDLDPVLEAIMVKKRKTSLENPEAIESLVNKWRTLRRFCVQERRAELATVFVDFCEGKINSDRFCKKVKTFEADRQRRSLKKSLKKPAKSGKGCDWKSFRPA